MVGSHWHASPRSDSEPTGDRTTGEIRVPLEVWSVDQPQGPVDLVLSSREAEQLYARLSFLLHQSSLSSQRSAPGAVTV
jgi:hypothetical protein